MGRGGRWECVGLPDRGGKKIFSLDIPRLGNIAESVEGERRGLFFSHPLMFPEKERFEREKSPQGRSWRLLDYN